MCKCLLFDLVSYSLIDMCLNQICLLSSGECALPTFAQWPTQTRRVGVQCIEKSTYGLCFAMFCCAFSNLSISFGVTSLALGKSYDCPRSSDVTHNEYEWISHKNLQETRVWFKYNMYKTPWSYSGIILRPANERRRYNVSSPLIGLAHTQNDPCQWNKTGLPEKIKYLPLKHCHCNMYNLCQINFCSYFTEL